MRPKTLLRESNGTVRFEDIQPLTIGKGSISITAAAVVNGNIESRNRGALEDNGLYLPMLSSGYEWEIVTDDTGHTCLVVVKSQ